MSRRSKLVIKCAVAAAGIAAFAWLGVQNSKHMRWAREVVDELVYCETEPCVRKFTRSDWVVENFLFQVQENGPAKSYKVASHVQQVFGMPVELRLRVVREKGVFLETYNITYHYLGAFGFEEVKH